jgi:hypothetical protein
MYKRLMHSGLARICIKDMKYMMRNLCGKMSSCMVMTEDVLNMVITEDVSSVVMTVGVHVYGHYIRCLKCGHGSKCPCVWSLHKMS